MEPQKRKRMEFIARRKQLGYSQKSLAKKLGIVDSTVRAWEAGTRIPTIGVWQALAEALEVNMIELGRLLGVEPDIEIDQHKVQQWLGHYGMILAGSVTVAKVERQLISDLLQTRAYATALEASFPGATSQEITNRVANRLRRQDMLARNPDPLGLMAVIHESVLHSNIGSPEVTAEQLRHLSLMADRSNIEIRILPDDERSACVPSSFEILSWPNEPSPVMVVTYDAGGAHYHEGDARRPFLRLYDHLLLRVALTPEESAARIYQIREDLQQ